MGIRIVSCLLLVLPLTGCIQEMSCFRSVWIVSKFHEETLCFAHDYFLLTVDVNNPVSLEKAAKCSTHYLNDTTDSTFPAKELRQE